MSVHFFARFEPLPGKETEFREELLRHARSGWALFGLWQCLKAEGKKSEARQAEAEFKAAWKNADVKLTVEDL